MLSATKSSTSLFSSLNLCLFPHYLTTKKTKPVFPRNTKRNILHNLAQQDSTQSFPWVNSSMCSGGHRENKNVHSREMRVLGEKRRARERESNVLFCLFGFRESFLYVHRHSKKQKNDIFICLFLYTTLRTIFLAYKRTIAEESNNRLIWRLFHASFPARSCSIVLFYFELFQQVPFSVFILFMFLSNFTPPPFRCVQYLPPPFRVFRRRCLSQSEQKKIQHKKRSLNILLTHAYTYTTRRK